MLFKRIFFYFLFSLFFLSCKDKVSQIPIDIQKKLYTANEAFLERRFTEALDICNSIEKRYPDMLNNNLLQVKIHYYTQRFEDSQEILNKLYKEHPENQEVLLWLGRVYLIIQDFDNSEKYLKMAKRNHPSGYISYYLLGELYRQRGDIKNSLVNYQHSLKVENDLLDIYNSYAELLSDVHLEERANLIREKSTLLEKHVK